MIYGNTGIPVRVRVKDEKGHYATMTPAQESSLTAQYDAFRRSIDLSLARNHARTINFSGGSARIASTYGSCSIDVVVTNKNKINFTILWRGKVVDGVLTTISALSGAIANESEFAETRKLAIKFYTRLDIPIQLFETRRYRGYDELSGSMGIFDTFIKFEPNKFNSIEFSTDGNAFSGFIENIPIDGTVFTIYINSDYVRGKQP